jgi:hypothetical protein
MQRFFFRDGREQRLFDLGFERAQRIVADDLVDVGEIIGRGFADLGAGNHGVILAGNKKLRSREYGFDWLKADDFLAHGRWKPPSKRVPHLSAFFAERWETRIDQCTVFTSEIKMRLDASRD